MNIFCRTLTSLGLAAVTLSIFAAAPVQARGFHPFRNERMRHAARLDRDAAQAQARDNSRKAAKMRSRAYHLRHERFGL